MIQRTLAFARKAGADSPGDSPWYKLTPGMAGFRPPS